jgi:hypothetical protein
VRVALMSTDGTDYRITPDYYITHRDDIDAALRDRRYRTQGRSLLRSDPFLQTLWANVLLESQFLTVIEVDCDLPQVFWARPAPTVP